ncbi:hypothetical protein [Natrarchaeobius chitinivorans]|uniref:Integral membrane protein n=1 Tax=Natrarchaeobius chitinivorans TaxID=1679083 RepID=A0A3N6M777_NATCH|nr:hypothetical protein [Natrarchaeobius chitinivorans]RQG96484.1 hypothetical protein EA473_05030 [Natrarchaeobius chitinivorans]
MSRSNRRGSLLLGALIVVFFLWSVPDTADVIAADPTSPTSVALVVAGALILVGGVAFVLAGVSDRLTVAGRTIEWWEFQGVGFAALGVYMAVSGLTQSSLASVLGVSMIVAGAGFLGFGLYRLRSGVPTEDAAASV